MAIDTGGGTQHMYNKKAAVDLIGCRPLAQCARVAEVYDEAKDVAFFDDPPLDWRMHDELTQNKSMVVAGHCPAEMELRSGGHDRGGVSCGFYEAQCVADSLRGPAGGAQARACIFPRRQTIAARAHGDFPMAITLAFDVYGTLINTDGVLAELEKHAGGRAGEFARLWRDKQLEYSFRRGLMRRYEHFGVCTAQALDYTSAFLDIPLAPQAKDALLGVYATLPAFDDVPDALAHARACGLRMFAFSNGRPEAVEGLLQAAGIRQFFIGIVSVDAVRSFKPNPDVYRYFLQSSGAAASGAWMVSGNPFDVIGALAAGMRAAWVRRTPAAVFDPWGLEPTLTVGSLAGLADAVAAQAGQR